MPGLFGIISKGPGLSQRDLLSMGLRMADSMRRVPWLRTEIWGGSLTPEAEKAQAERVALGHIGEPEDIAGIVAFLASPAARFITGEVILVDGGRGTCDYLPTGLGSDTNQANTTARRQP